MISDYYPCFQRHIQNGIIGTDYVTRECIMRLGPAENMILFDQDTGFVFRVVKDPLYDSDKLFNRVHIVFYRSKKAKKIYGESIGNFDALTVDDLNHIRFTKKDSDEAFYPIDLVENKSAI